MNTQVLKQGTPEWLEAREGRINASELGAILGCSPFTGPKAMLKNKIAKKPFYTSEAMQWGNDNESKARAMYDFLYGAESDVEETGYWAIELDGIPLGASPDGLIGEGLVEIKCPWKLRDDERPAFDSIDGLRHYWHQIQLQLLATDRQWCDFFQWAPNGFKCERVERDPDWWDSVKDQVGKFYSDYLAGLETKADAVGSLSRFAAASEAYLMAKRTKLAAEKDMEEARMVLISMCEQDGVTEAAGSDLQITLVESKGAIDYKKWANVNDYTVPEEYRKAGRVSWRITETGDK